MLISKSRTMGKVVVVEWLSAEKMLSRCLPPPPSPSGVNAMLMGQGVHFLSTISSYPFYFDKLSCALRFAVHDASVLYGFAKRN